MFKIYKGGVLQSFDSFRSVQVSLFVVPIYRLRVREGMLTATLFACLRSADGASGFAGARGRAGVCAVHLRVPCRALAQRLRRHAAHPRAPPASARSARVTPTAASHHTEVLREPARESLEEGIRLRTSIFCLPITRQNGTIEMV